MSKQLKFTTEIIKIGDVYQMIKNDSLILQPYFQRKLVWSLEHKLEFIDTILQGLPFPEIFIAKSGININAGVDQSVVVDGQQRLNTILNYIDGELISDGSKVKNYSNLTEQENESFLEYELVTRDLGDISPEKIKEVFKRINKTQYSLDQIEIQNAVYDGKFISTAKSILEQIDNESIPIFSETELTRMADLHFILLVMATIEEEGYFSLDNEIEKYIITYNDKYDFAEAMISKLVNTFDFITNLELDADSIWFRKANFFTLTVELFYLIDKDILDRDVIKSNLESFEENVFDNRYEATEANDYSRYYAAIYSGSNSRKSRVRRSHIFRDYIVPEY